MPRGGGSGGRGKKFTHKGGHRTFTSQDDIIRQQEEIRKEKERAERGEVDEEGNDKEGTSEDTKPRVVKFRTKKADGEAESSSESESSEESSDEDNKKAGVHGLIDVQNPNRVKQKMKKMKDLTLENTKPELSRKDREAMEAEKAKLHYQKLHAQGKTDEAQKDLARLAIIRKQREEAAKKRAEDKAKAEAAKTSRK